MTDSKPDLGVLCTSCGRKKAVYLRRASGERLCTSCFEKALIKTIKRVMRNVKKLRPGATIASIVIPERLIASLTMLYCLNKVEVRYGCRVLALVFDVERYKDVVRDVINLVVKGRLGFDGSSLEIVEGSKDLKDTASGILKYYLEVLPLNIDSDVDVVALPLTLNDVNEVILSSLLSSDLSSALLLPSFEKGTVTYVIPFYNVPAYDVYAFSYVRGIYDSVLDDLILRIESSTYIREDYVIIKELVKDLSYNNPELTQTLVKSVNLLLRSY